MKKFLYVGVAMLSLVVYSCSDNNSNSAQNPNDVADQFANPTGTLTASNVNDIGEASANASGSGGLTDPLTIGGLSKTTSQNIFGKFPMPYNALEESDIEACIETSDTETTIDWECVFNLDEVDECTGGGTSVTDTSSSSEGFYTVEYNDFSVDCGTGTEFSCNGTINISTETLGTYCSDLTCTIAGDDHIVNACINSEGEMLITVEGETFVIGGFTVNDTCDGFSLTVTDSQGDHAVSCGSTFSNGSCDATEVDTVTDCSID